MDRQLYAIDFADEYDEHDPRTRVDPDDPSAISSEKVVYLPGGGVATLLPPLHAPVLDIDFPARLVPSSTPGHFHLYLDTEMLWEDYAKLLGVLADVGIIEQGYYWRSLERGASFVRLPGIQK